MDMEHWGGFTDVELNSLRQRGRGRRAARRSRGPPLNQGTRRVIYPIGRGESMSNKASGGDLPSDAFLSHKTQPSNDKPPESEAKGTVDGTLKQDSSSTGEGATVTDNTGDTGVTLTESPAISLEEMQKQQRIIEELNKKKKAMLQETIQQRYKQTQQESQTLTIVNQELSKLDQMISSEIGILREKIEEANRQYNNDRKRFERAEKEYIESKISLHQSTENKELLAEHLCAVIQENEIRKAKKLEELMIKLNLSVGENDSSSSKVLTYQRTPTPRYGHWPQSPTAVVPQSTVPDSENCETKTNVDGTDNVTPSEDLLSSNKTITDVSSCICEPIDSSCDADSGSSSVPVSDSHDPQRSSSDSGSVPANKPDTESANSVENGSQDSGSQANS